MSMTMKSGAGVRFEPGSWKEAAHDVYIGLVVGVGHVNNIFLYSPYNYMFGVKTETTLLPKGDIKVMGVGFGRTGTYSVKLALDQLGYPTLHTQHLYEDENEQIFQRWTENIFKPSVEQGTAMMGEPDFDIITQHGYVATMDFPFALYYEHVMEMHPDCKFILTTRDNSEVWFRSWDTLTKSISTPANLGGIFLTGVQRYSIYLRWLFSVVNKDDTYLTSSIPQATQYKEAAINSYETHNQRVREIIPQDRLLEYSVKQGWEPLCQFMKVGAGECPQTPFPKTNSARSVQVQSISATILPLIVILFALFYLFARGFQRMTGRTVMQWINLQTTLVPQFLRRTMIGSSKQYQAQSQPQKSSTTSKQYSPYTAAKQN